MGSAAAGRLRQRFRVVMVDEFQDTDPVQWEILHRAFHGAATLILDRRPQAGDLRVPGRRCVQLSRRGQPLRRRKGLHPGDQLAQLTEARGTALESMIGGATLGEDEIVVRPVVADDQERADLDRPSGGGPRPRWSRSGCGCPVPPEAETAPSVASLRPRIIADRVADVTPCWPAMHR